MVQISNVLKNKKNALKKYDLIKQYRLKMPYKLFYEWKNFFIIQSINDYSFYYLFYCLIFFLQLKPHLSGTISKNKMDK